MKRAFSRLIMLLVLLASPAAQAQTPAANAPSAVLADTASQQPAVKPHGAWLTASTPALKIDQHYYQNWSATGISQISFLCTFDGDYKYTTEKFVWDNIINMALGLYWQDLDGDTTQHGLSTFESRRKNDDKIDLSSTFSMKLKNPWNLNATANLKSQFFEGYTYASGDTTLISNFMAPAYLITSVGFERKKPSWNISLSFLTGKTTFLLDDKVIAAGQLYGVDTSNGSHVYAGLGSYIKLYFKKDIAKNLNLYTRCELFYDYGKPSYHDRIYEGDAAAFGAWTNAAMYDASCLRRMRYCLFHDTDIDFEYKLEYRFSTWLACYTALHMRYDSDFSGTHRFMGKEDSSWQLYASTGLQVYFNWKTPKAG